MSRVNKAFVIASAAIGFTIACAFSTYAEEESSPRLILQITVDGLRADLLTRYGGHFGEDGFRALLESGAVYTNAHYQHANTETIVGHATLATGSSPAQHGMTGNVWYDRPSGELAYNIEDPDHPLLPTRTEELLGAQVDPAQKLARTRGRSPRAILVPTFGDALKKHTAGRAKVFGISGKDRSAVAMAGHTGKAFWFSTDTGDFVTSDYYYDDYPEWIVAWNRKRMAEGYAGKSWELSRDLASYVLGHQDDRPYETDLKGYGRTFPHPFGPADHPLFHTRLLVSPVGDRLLLDLAKELIQSERVGQDEVTDYLSVSFSGVDAVNHFFGPSSLENEDVVLSLDRTLAELLAYIDETVGLERTVIAFSADHGMAEIPEYMTELGYRAARLHPEDVIRIANEAGREAFGIDEICLFFFRPYLYLDDEELAAAGVDRKEALLTVARALKETEGIGLAVPHGIETGQPLDQARLRVENNYHLERSGDIYVAPDPYWYLYEKGPIAVMHGSPWNYDTHVPIVFVGPGIAPKEISREVHPADVAPTLAAILRMTPPAGATGHPLPEVLDR